MTTQQNIEAQRGIDPLTHIGKKCRKTSAFKTGKPFKSKQLYNTIRGVAVHPLTGTPAFVFEEDESVVEASRCYVIEPRDA